MNRCDFITSMGASLCVVGLGEIFETEEEKFVKGQYPNNMREYNLPRRSAIILAKTTYGIRKKMGHSIVQGRFCE